MTDIDPEVVATEIGMGGMETTSTRRPSIHMIQILVPPSMRDGSSDASVVMAAHMTQAKEALLPVRPHTRGRPMT